MATDDMKPEMIRILQTMFKTPDGKMEVKEIEGLLKLPSQQTQYYLDELNKEELIEFNYDWKGEQRHSYTLTVKGRAYVMENLME